VGRGYGYLYFFLSLLNCEKIGNNYYIADELALKCFTKEYIMYSLIVVMPVAIFFVFTVPALLFYLIRKDIIIGQKSIVKK